MSIDRHIAERAVELLNEALALDPGAVSSLCGFRVDCNEALAEHPSIQVGDLNGDDVPEVGLLGLLNGIAGANDDAVGSIAAFIEDESGAVTGFGLLEERL